MYISSFKSVTDRVVGVHESETLQIHEHLLLGK